MKVKKKYGSFDESAEPGSPPPGMYVPLEFPSLVTLDKRTRDGRLVHGDDFEPFELPLSIQAKLVDGPQHDGAFIMGRLDEVTVWEDGNVSGRGWALNDDDGRKVARLVKSGAMRGNSVDLSIAQGGMSVDVREDDAGNYVIDYDYTGARLQATTILPKPAFQDSGATVTVPDGWTVDGVDDPEAVTAAAEAEPLTVSFNVVKDRPKVDRSLFDDPELPEPTPNFIDEGGHVYGHIAAWNAAHLSQQATAPPRSRSGYAFFANKHLLTDDGYVAVGVLVKNCDHADRSVGWREALDHYANTGAAWADVAVGEDEHGIWYSGMVRRSLSAEQVNECRASVPSGDWRRIGTDMELIAAQAVNTGGFPIPRPQAFGHDEEFLLSLTGAGIVTPKHGGLLLPAAHGTFTMEVPASVEYLANRFAAEDARALAGEIEGFEF